MSFNAAFKKWYGESKCAYKNGNPRLVHHGTPKRFKAFDRFPAYFSTSMEEVREDFFFSEGMIVSAYLSIQNPLIVSGEGWEDEIANQPYNPKWLNSVKDMGNDGVLWENTGFPVNHPSDWWLAFYPDQIRIVRSVHGR